MTQTLPTAPLTDPAQLLRIGQLQQQSQVPIKTIRYYEELGLIPVAQRTEGGFRLFKPAVLKRLAFIRRSQKLGLSLQEIGEILQIHDRGQLPCDNVRHKLNDKISAIDEQIRQLSILREELVELMAVDPNSPQFSQPNIICPIIENQQY